MSNRIHTRRQRFPRGLKQPEQGYRFSVDSLLLACYAQCKPAERIIELGTGCGVTLFALLIRHPDHDLQTTGLDISLELLEYARQNCCGLGFENHFCTSLGDVRSVANSTVFKPESFDRVLCNPPYRSLGQGKQSPLTAKNQARFEVSGSLDDFLQAGAYLLKNKGTIILVYLSEALNSLFLKLTQYRLEPKQIRFVHARNNSRSRIFLIQAVKNAKAGLIVNPPLILYSQEQEFNKHSAEAEAFCPFLACNRFQPPNDLAARRSHL